jgi:general secretion pathway protein K
MTNRHGFALLAALWLVIAIAVIGLQFSLEARERRLSALYVVEHGEARAVASAGLEAARARLEFVLRNRQIFAEASQEFRAADPWLGPDTLLSTLPSLGDVSFTVLARDVGGALNINRASEADLRNLFVALDLDYGTAEQLSQSIMDWRDTDDLARSRGAERDEYIRDGRLVLPRNAAFQELTELLDVYGMTPELYEHVSPYLVTHGSGRVNLNSASLPVLRAVPLLTERHIATIMSLREQGRRLRAVTDLPGMSQPNTGRGRGAGPGGTQQQPAQNLASRTTVTTEELELTIIGHSPDGAPQARLEAIVQRQGVGSRVTFRRVR